MCVCFRVCVYICHICQHLSSRIQEIFFFAGGGGMMGNILILGSVSLGSVSYERNDETGGSWV